ncbi:hypothetical protein KP509_33G066200 [Ceratopteris richardii]|uniref:Dirigent protein n=1 Tax=Ceratopteris richardii TaxID=49495 RepID=A0A8T2QSG2_CERRI|nr:hypothetical protein KP509_33G066200 [Ceratopteris richardii]
MEQQHFCLIAAATAFFLLTSHALQGVAAQQQYFRPFSPWASPSPSLEFYMYIAVQNNTYVGSAATYTAVQSAQPAQAQPFAFGTIHTFDNPLYAEASATSARVGRVQGWYGNTGQDILTLFLVQTFSLTGSRNGTLSLVGVDIATDEVKYGAIVGGTGDFTFARGLATQKLVSTQNVDQQIVSWFHYSIDLRY